jgi:hypothetical protein
MGGVWAHPIKIADGYWISVSEMLECSENTTGVDHWLTECDEFVLGDGGAWTQHSYQVGDYRVLRKQFIPHEYAGVGIEIRLSSSNDSLQYACLGFLIRFNMLSVWFSGWPDPASLDAEARGDTVVVRVVGDTRWAGAVKSDRIPNDVVISENILGPETKKGKGLSCLMKYEVAVNANAPLRFAIAGDHRGERYALGTAQHILDGFEDELSRKGNWYLQIVERNTGVRTPERLLNEAFRWAKLNLEWLIQESPLVGIGAVAGYQDFPWFFGVDIELSTAALLMVGFHDEAKQSLELLGKAGKKMMGRIPHEIVTTGRVYSRGHIMETALFARAVLDTYLGTGDEEFLDSMYPICRSGILDHVLSQPRSAGIILLEYQDIPESPREKLNPSFVVFGLEALADMARRRADKVAYNECMRQAFELKKQLEELFWDEKQGLYANALDQDNRPIIHFPGGFWPLQGGSLEPAFCSIADGERIARAFSKIEGSGYTSEWGLYLSEERELTMPVTSGLAAIGEFNYGRTDMGMRFVQIIARTLGHMMPGGFPEYIHSSGDPGKYPSTSCFVQLWSAAMLVQGLLWGLLHPKPDIPRGELALQPCLPTGWSSAKILNLRIGKSTYSFTLNKHGLDFDHNDGPELKILVKNQGWLR